MLDNKVNIATNISVISEWYKKTTPPGHFHYYSNNPQTQKNNTISAIWVTCFERALQYTLNSAYPKHSLIKLIYNLKYVEGEIATTNSVEIKFK